MTKKLRAPGPYHFGDRAVALPSGETTTPGAHVCKPMPEMHEIGIVRFECLDAHCGRVWFKTVHTTSGYPEQVAMLNRTKGKISRFEKKEE